MACLSALKGIGRSCVANLAGIKEVYIADYDAVTPGAEGANHTLTPTLAEGAKFYTYKFNKQTGSLTSEMTKDETNGTLYYTHTITLQFTRLEGAKHIEIEALAKGQLSMIILDNNNRYWFVGFDGYVSSDSVTAQTGQSYDDLSGYNTTLSAMSAHLPFEITKEVFDALPVEAAPTEAE